MTTPFLFVPIFSWPAAPGGKLHTYAAGGTTPQTTWSDAAGSVANTNPVTLDSNGTATVRLASGQAYHFVLKDSTDTTTLWDEDNYQSSYLTQSDIGGLLYPRTSSEISAGVTPTNYSYQPGNVLRFGADPLGVSDSTTAINNTLASSLNVYIPAGTYLITGSLVYQNNQNIYGAGYLNTTIKANLSNASYFRSSFGESPTVGQRTTGVRIADLAIFPATATTITSGSIGVNFKNAQYSMIERVLMQYVDTGFATDQFAQYNNYHRVIVQVANTGASLASIGGGNKLIGCDIAGNVVGADFNGGAYDIVGGTYEALLTTTTYCMRFGRPGGQATYFTATGLYIEGTNAAIVPAQFENSVIGSAFSAHLHSTLGGIVNNANTGEVIIKVRGYFDPQSRVVQLSLSNAINGSQTALFKSTASNTIASRNAADSDYATHFVSNIIANRVAITYSASMTPDALAGRTQVITATNGTAFTIANPINGLAGGQRITIVLKNTSGGALGAATWGGNYKMSAWTNPANGNNRSIEFEFDGSSLWYQVSQTGVDVPN